MENKLLAAVAESDAVIRRAHGTDWGAIDPVKYKRFEDLFHSRNAFRQKREVTVPRSLLLLLRLYPDLAQYRNVSVFSKYVHYAIAVLMATSARVTWYCYGAPTSMASVVELLGRYRDRFEMRATSLLAPDFRRDGPTDDLIIVDNADAEPQAFALQLCGAAALVGARPGARLLVYGMTPRSPEPAACLTAAWDVLFRGMRAARREPMPSLHPFCKWWVCFEAREGGGPDAARAERVSAACVRGLTDADFGPPSAELLEAAAACHSEVAAALREAFKNVKVDAAAVGRARVPDLREKPFAMEVVASSLRPGCYPLKPDAYQRDGRDFRPSCHWGQLKLLVSEIEFLTDCRALGLVEGAVVIYAGASPGDHIDALIELFPGVRKWILLDSARSTVRSTKADVRGPGKAGFVTDEVVRALRAETRDSLVLFVSDIRTSTDEATVANEMRHQARWGVHLRARAMLLKFRLPYVDLDGTYLNSGTKLADLALDPADAKLLKRPAAPRPKGAASCGGTGPCFDTVHDGGDVLYLLGRIQPQTFAPPTSTETRLFVVADRAGKYATAHYNPVTYETQLSEFNDTVRSRGDLYLYRDPPQPENLVPGLDGGWESLRIHDIARAYLGPGADPGEAQRLVRTLEEGLAAATGTTLLRCTLNTYAKRRASAHHNAAERAIIDTWTRIWRVRLEDYKAVLRERLLLRGAAVFGPEQLARMLRELQAGEPRG